MFNLIQYWSHFMSKRAPRAVKRRLSEKPRVQLIPVVDESPAADRRRKEIQTLLSTMFADLHRRGRPKKEQKEESSHVA